MTTPLIFASDFVVTFSTTNQQFDSAATAHSGGGVAVVYEDISGACSDTCHAEVRTRLFDAGATPLGMDIDLTTTCVGDRSVAEPRRVERRAERRGSRDGSQSWVPLVWEETLS